MEQMNSNQESSESVSSDEDIYNVDKILDIQVHNGVEHYLVKWEGYGSDQNTWEPLKSFSPNYSLVDEFLAERKQKMAKQKENNNQVRDRHLKEEQRKMKEKKREKKDHSKKRLKKAENGSHEEPNPKQKNPKKSKVKEAKEPLQKGSKRKSCQKGKIDYYKHRVLICQSENTEM
jgi:ATPase subunit of ABC transporter with duplicated ATPase domains